MPRKYNTYSDEMLIEAVRTSTSIRQVLGKIGLDVAGGGNYKTVKRNIQRLSLDTNHFTGQGHLKGKSHKWAKQKYSLEEILVKNSPYKGTNTRLKKRLIKASLVEDQCCIEGCSVKGLWLGKEIILHLDHVNGINDDFRLSNLRLLCPNCHSQTSTYCGKNKKKGRKPLSG